MKRWEGITLAACTLTLALFVWIAVNRPPYVPPGADEQIPAGGELIYHNPGPLPVRVIRIGECYITQVVEENGTGWLVLNRGIFMSDEASIDCTSGAPPVLP